MKTFKNKRALLVIVFVLVLGGIAIAMLRSQPDAAKEKEAAGPKPSLTVTTVRPLEARLPIKLAANGNIEAWEEASIGSESNGLRLSAVLVNVGDKVKAGQVLARFDGESVESEVAQARANLLEAQANAAEAVANADRARKLETTGALSKQEIIQFFTTEQTAQAKVAASKAMLDAQQLRLKHVVVRAPDSGVITERKATVGAVASAGTELFRMIRKGRLEWRAEVTSAELGRISAGTPVSLTAANGTVVKGKVRMIAPTVNPENRTALVYVDLLAPVDTTAASAKAGMFARGEFDLGSSAALTLPQQAVVMREGFSYIFELGADNRVRQIKIQTGRRIGDRVELLTAIKPGATVVAAGAGFLNDGDLVRVENVPVPPVASPVAPAAATPAQR